MFVEDERILKDPPFLHWRGWRKADITAATSGAVLGSFPDERAEARSWPTRTLALHRRIFNRDQARDRSEQLPASKIKAPAAGRERDRVLGMTSYALLKNAASDAGVVPDRVQALPVHLQRHHEVLGMRFQIDLEAAWWTILASRIEELCPPRFCPAVVVNCHGMDALAQPS